MKQVKSCSPTRNRTHCLSLTVGTFLPWATAPPSWSSHHPLFYFKTYLGYILPQAVAILPRISCQKIHEFPILFHEEHANTYLTPTPQSVIDFRSQMQQVSIQLLLDRDSNTEPFAESANTLPQCYQATRSSHHKLIIITMVYKSEISPTTFHLKPTLVTVK